MTRWILIAGVVCAGIGAWVLLSEPQGVPVVTAKARKGQIRSYIEERARSRLPEIHRITMPQQGRILPIEVVEGDRVEQDQIVARMDTTDIETDFREATNSVEQYQKMLAQVILSIQQADQTVLASREKYKYFEREFGRAMQLFRRDSLTESQKQESELRMVESRVEMRNDEMNKEMYTIGKAIVELLKDTEIGKQEKVERDRERAVIRTPVEGTVLRREVSNERVMQAGEILLEIGELNKLEIVVEVLTQEAAKLKTGNAVDIEGAALGGQILKGQVSRIFPQGFTKVSSLGVEQQRVNVIVTFDSGVLDELQQQGIQLGADYRLRVKIYTAKKDDAIIIPRSALFRSSDGTWQLFAIRDNRAELRTVEIGLKNDFEVEITKGLDQDDKVIVAPDSELTNGMVVETQSSQ